jgi:hypothetical protein
MLLASVGTEVCGGIVAMDDDIYRVEREADD